MIVSYFIYKDVKHLKSFNEELMFSNDIPHFTQGCTKQQFLDFIDDYDVHDILNIVKDEGVVLEIDKLASAVIIQNYINTTASHWSFYDKILPENLFGRMCRDIVDRLEVVYNILPVSWNEHRVVIYLLK